MKQQVLSVLALGWLVGLAPATRAEIITFDDISAPTTGMAIPNGYQGLHWINFDVIKTTAAPGSEFAHGMVSTPNVAFNGEGASAKILSSTLFDLNSGFFTGAFRDGLTIHAKGWRLGTLEYQTTFKVNSGGPTFEQLNFLGVDRVMFVSSGGKPNKDRHGTGEHFIVDNLDINTGIHIQGQSAPEPSTLTLFLVGAILTGAYSWRRWRAL
jgi:hypothetical protein